MVGFVIVMALIKPRLKVRSRQKKYRFLDNARSSVGLTHEVLVCDRSRGLAEEVIFQILWIDLRKKTPDTAMWFAIEQKLS